MASALSNFLISRLSAPKGLVLTGTFDMDKYLVDFSDIHFWLSTARRVGKWKIAD